MLFAIALLLASATLGFSSEQLPLSTDHSSAVGTASDDAPSYRSELLSLHKSLVSIPSISGNENEVGNFVVKYLTEKGYGVNIQFVPKRNNTQADRERFNVVAWRGQGALRPKVLVTSHIDVVPPHIPYAIDDGPVTKKTMIKGRGSVDAKGSVASMIVALDELVNEDKVDGTDVMLLFVVGEEVAGDGMHYFSDSLAKMPHPPAFDAVIFGEPTENKLACGHKGGVFCDLAARGFGGHSGYPWLGKSANELMVRAMAKIYATDLGSSELYGNTTVNLGRFNGGVASNVIAEHATAGIAVRVAIGPEKEGGAIVQQRIQDILDEIDDEAFEFTCHQAYGAVDCDCDVEGFETDTMNYGTDIPNLAGNHSRYLYGPGTILVAHGARENLTVGDLETAVEGFQRLILHALEK
ncbi:hypothetical protein S40293_01702 [Stachybotrys chartarum IBT 40293]|nr:hypothetical protein S40293_01702 [Stachybotrys chartarum IBT 40293]